MYMSTVVMRSMSIPSGVWDGSRNDGPLAGWSVLWVTWIHWNVENGSRKEVCVTYVHRICCGI